jgi:hypothetical protein
MTIVLTKKSGCMRAPFLSFLSSFLPQVRNSSWSKWFLDEAWGQQGSEQVSALAFPSIRMLFRASFCVMNSSTLLRIGYRWLLGMDGTPSALKK